MMARVGGFGQACGAGGVDRKGAVGDGYVTPFVKAQPVGRISFYVAINARKFNVVVSAVSPDLGPREKIPDRQLTLLEEFRCDNKVLRCDNINAMGERLPAKICIEERYDTPHRCNAKPNCHVFGPVWHQQRNRFTLCDILRERPASIAVRTVGKLTITQALLS